MSEKETKYGFCVGCKKWVKRDDMLGINVHIYDESGLSEKVLLRYCPKCHGEKVLQFKLDKWDNELKTAGELDENCKCE